MTGLDGIKLVASVGDGKTTACLMSARALLDGRPFGDKHPSAALRRLGIRINDGPWWDSDEERTAVLLPLALDERLCASRCVVTPEAEKERGRIVCAWAVPYAMDAAIRAMGAAATRAEADGSPHAKKLREAHDVLKAKPTRENALEAYAADAAAYASASYASSAAYAYAADAAAYAADAAAYAAAYASAYADDAAAYADAYAADAADAAAYAAAYADDAAAYALLRQSRRTTRCHLTRLFGECLAVGQ